MDKHSMEEERRRRERRHRERKEREAGRKDKESSRKDGKVRKPRGLDLIDKLDVSGIYGPSSKSIRRRRCHGRLLTDTPSVPP